MSTTKMTALYERTACPNPEYIRRQRNNLEAYATSNGFANLQHFTDDGYSAFDYKRPGFTALLTAMKAGEIDTIIVKDIARIARDFTAFHTFTDQVRMLNIRFIAIMDKIDILPMHIHDDSNGLNYTLNGDYYIPNILDPALEDHRPLGKWGMMRMDYLKAHRPGIYSHLLLSGKLHSHLADLDEQARDRHELVVRQMAQAEGITEQLKMHDQMTWVGMMNNIAARVDEIIRDELIFK